VLLDAGSNFAAGAIGLEIPWTTTNLEGGHPFHRVQFAFIAPPEKMPGEGEDPVQCDVWTSGFAYKVEPSTAGASTCGVHLDPRDSANRHDWLNGELNSRVLFGDADIHSSFFSVTGHRFLLNATAHAAARLGFLFDQIDVNQNVTTLGRFVFHPEGPFVLHSTAPADAAGPNSSLNISSRDFIVGNSTTEFFDIKSAAEITRIEFVKGPAFLLKEDQPYISDRTLLSDGGGVVVTSHIRFANDDTPVEVGYHSQASGAPLFETSTVSPEHLRRRRERYGALGVKGKQQDTIMPVFPHAGHRSGDDRIQQFETTHLSPYRRKKGRSAFVRAADADSITTLAITPQGILAEVRPDETYQTLYFGNPESATARDDFCIAINGTGPLYHDIQQALRSSQLFMVLRNPKDEVLRVLQPSSTLFARNPFAFTILGTDLTMKAAAFIVKYFKGKSVEQLLENPALWACQGSLAPNGNTDLKAWSPFNSGQKPPDYLKRLQDVWEDPNWQGILIIDFPMTNEPDIIKALRPGLAGKNNVVELRAPYFGINALPVKAEDLKSKPTSRQTPPRRPGAVFGMVRYDKVKGNEPTPPKTDDEEPGTTGPGTRTYALIVETLSITLENSQIAEFTAKVFVKFDHLFWDDPVPPAHGDRQSLELHGYYERRGAEDVFSLVSPTQFVVKFKQDSYLKQLTIKRALLEVESSNSDRLTAFVGIDGTLEMSEKLELPFFRVKSIQVSKFGFEYDFKKADPGQDFNFRFKADKISADIDFTADGVPSLLSFLPAKLKGMKIAFKDLLDLEALQFTPIPFKGLGTKCQFGFLMELDFGSLGKLAGDLSGLKLPMLIGWGGGKSQGLAFGIQFPNREGKGFDIGFQQFIRLHADELELKRCPPNGDAEMIGIHAVNAKVIMLGHTWPSNAEAAIAIFIPLKSGRRPSWAFGIKYDGDKWYVGGGYRIILPDPGDKTVKDVVESFYTKLNDINKKTDICTLGGRADASRDDWSIIGRYLGELKIRIAVSDPTLYGVAVDIPGLGELDVMYRRINSQLGLFSIEYTLPPERRTMQIGVASVRLPVIRLEIHTDGGFLVDFGFPWNNDFSRSCQVEIAIYVGSGGFYYGITSAAASDLLTFEGGYGFLKPDDKKLNDLKALRFGFALRVGIGRSFTIGILYAEASVTVFGGVEGAIAYRSGSNLFDPTLYAVKGYVGVMVDIRATVDFAIIKAHVQLLIYVEVGFEIRRLLGKKPGTAHEHHLLRMPIVVFAEVGIRIIVAIEISIGCVSVTIQLEFNATWRYEETLTDFKDEGTYTAVIAGAPLPSLPLPKFFWNPAYQYWPGARDLEIYATVLPCMANPADVGETGSHEKTCAVGTLLLPVRQLENGLGDLARFLVGWLLLPPNIGQANIDTYQLTLKLVKDFQTIMREKKFWDDFQVHLIDLAANKSRTISGAIQPQDHFRIKPNSTAPGADAGGRTIMKGPIGITWDAGNPKKLIATVTALADSKGNEAFLTGALAVRNHRIILKLTRNETFGSTQAKANSALIYECAPVESPICWTDIKWPGPLEYQSAGRPLHDALKELFDGLLRGVDLSEMKIDFTYAHTWQSGKLNVANPFSVRAPDIKPPLKTSAEFAQFISEKHLALLGATEPPDVKSAHQLHIKLSTLDDTSTTSRVLLNIDEIEFPS
jgi:hypothetical protein